MSKSISVADILSQSLDCSIAKQQSDGSFPSGNNDIYDDSQTPVRTTANWCIALTNYYQKYGGERYFQAAKAAAQYLSEKNRPHDATFYCRKSADKDKCNGVVGQAFPIIALGMANELFDEPIFIETAVDVFLCHPFDWDVGLWKAVEVDGTVLSYDRTLNHQLSFAAAAAVLSGSESRIADQLDRFLTRLPDNLSLAKTGRIRHYVDCSWSLAFFRLSLLRNKILLRLRADRQREIKYHCVNLFDLAIIRSRGIHHSIWRNKKIQMALEFLETNRYEEKITDLGLTDTATGLQNAVILDTFERGSEPMIAEWLERQFRHNYDFDNHTMNKDSEDPEFRASTIYALTFLSNYEFNV